MMRKSVLVFAIGSGLLAAGCSQNGSGVRVTNDTAAAAVSADERRREPVFFNGKTYQLEFAPAGGGRFAMAVSGMSKGQQKDAVTLATSSLRYFKCADGQNGVLADKPKYVEDQWRMTARCG
jgi:hypothetical protein